jgi:hypothetical protein
VNIRVAPCWCLWLDIGVCGWTLVNIRVAPCWCLWLDIGEYTCRTFLVFVVGHW